MLSLLRLECEQTENSSNPFRSHIFSFFLTHLELKHSYNPIVPSKTIPESRPKWAVYTRFQTTLVQKPYRMGRHITKPQIAYIREYPPPPPPKEIQYYYFAFAMSFMEATGVKNQYVGRTFLSLARFWHTLRGLLSRIK